MTKVRIRKQAMEIGQAKDMENTIAQKEKFEAFMEYIAICDHPEMFGDENEEVAE